MQTRCPNCSTIVRTLEGEDWVVLGGPCPELSGTRWADKAEFCPTLSQVTRPDVVLPGVTERQAVLTEIQHVRERRAVLRRV